MGRPPTLPPEALLSYHPCHNRLAA